MRHKFKINPEGAYKTTDGLSYDVVCVNNDDTKHTKKAGWCDSLENAIRANLKGKKAKVEEGNEGAGAV